MQNNKKVILFSIAGIAFTGAVCAVRKCFPKVSMKKYTQACLYMAVLDDEIARNELEGNLVVGRELIFPPRQESLQFRYQLFLNQYRRSSPRQLDEAIQSLEGRLSESRQYVGQPERELNVMWADS